MIGKNGKRVFIRLVDEALLAGGGNVFQRTGNLIKVHVKIGDFLRAQTVDDGKTFADLHVLSGGFVQVWEKLPVVSSDNAKNPDPDAFQFKFFVADPKAKAANGSWIVQRKVAGNWQDESQQAKILNTSFGAGKVLGKRAGRSIKIDGFFYTADFAAFAGGTYRVRFKYKNSSVNIQPFTGTGGAPGASGELIAFQAEIVSAKANNEGMLVREQAQDPKRYGILPFSHFSADNIQAPDTNLTDKWKLASPAQEAPTLYFAKQGGNPSVEFGTFVAFAPAAGNEARTHLIVTPDAATREGDGPLVTTSSKGLFYMDGDAKILFSLQKANLFALAGADANTAWQDAQLFQGSKPQTKDVAGHVDPFHFIVPDLDVGSPNGDPTQTGANGANATNEQVFDDQIPAGEAAGQCKLTMEAKGLPKLSQAARDLVHAQCIWTIGAIGGQGAQFNPGNRKGRQVDVLYATMPARYDDFKKRKIELVLDGKPWRWYQDVEFFFHFDGTGGRPGPNPAPNWFVYWKQIKAAVAGAGNAGGVTFKPGALNAWTNPVAVGGASTIELAPPSSLSQYIGILAHEQKHENDFFDIVWAGAGFLLPAGSDPDGDTLRDAWERTQVMAAGTGFGPWVFDVPATPIQPAVAGTNAAQDQDVWVESTVAVRSWSDARADIAAKDAVNANLGIDAQDWSDLVVISGVGHSFNDPDRPATEKQTANPTTSGNNKDFVKK